MKAVFLLLFIFSMQLKAQTNSKNNFDVVKTYLLEIQQAVDYAPNFKKEKIDKLNKVIRLGTEQRRKLKQALKNTKSKKQQDEILSDINLFMKADVIHNTNNKVTDQLTIDNKY